ncbi:patatin-like phospholipase family protein [Hydrogenophaga sp.]|uniref:patatin-like phospholipase family protein n=1 Tax=Hydrogenophaga sp. TaxID=1904254 RepID=UPI0035AE4199
MHLSSRPGGRAFLLLAAFATLMTLAAPGRAADAPAGARPKVALVLSGGGARGLAHVGVLKVLEEARVPVDMIVGTSMGAIVGGLYAAGMDPGELADEVGGLDWGGLFQRSEPRQNLSQRLKEEDFEMAPLIELGFRDGEFRLPTGAVSTRALEVLLRRYTLATRHMATFDGLPTPFRAVATDMETGEAMVLDHGDLAGALRASMSVPGVFSPLEINGRLLGDGGLVNNLPVDVARRMGADVIIAVNIGTPLAGRDTLGTLLGVTTQMVNILTEQNVKRSIESLSPRDLLLAPPLGTISSADFGRGKELMDIGYGYAHSQRRELERFSVSAAEYAQWKLQRQVFLAKARSRGGWISEIRFDGVEASRVERIEQLIDSEAGQPLDVQRVEQDLRLLAATGDYERVDYHLENLGPDGTEALVVRLRDNDWGPNYLRMGLDLRTDFEGQSGFNLRLSHNRRWLNNSGAEWRNRLQLGENTAASTELYQPLGQQGDQFVSAHVGIGNRRVDLYGTSGQAAVVTRSDLNIGVDFGWPLGLLGHLGEARLGLVSSWHRTTPELIGGELSGLDPRVLTQRWNDSGVRFGLVSDQLDYANFPTSGHRLRGEVIGGRRHLNGGSTHGFVRWDLSATGVTSWGANTLNVGARLARTNRLAIGAIDEFSLGGFQQLSGFRIGQVGGSMLAFGRMTYYRRLPVASSPLARAMFAGGSLELGNAWLKPGDASLRDLLVGRSLFVGADTALGPLYLSVVSAPRGYTGLYLFLGRP